MLEALQELIELLTITDSSAFHFSFSDVHALTLFLKSIRNTINTMADPTSEAGPTKAIAFHPYAKPHSVAVVVKPIRGGNEVNTNDALRLIWY